MVFEMGLDGCIVVYYVEKDRKSLPGIENNMFKGMEAGVSKVLLDMSLARMMGADLGGP